MAPERTTSTPRRVARRPRTHRRNSGLAERLVGAWKIEGRTLNSPVTDISGRSVVEWLPGRHILQQRSVFRVAGQTLMALEIIDCSARSGVAPAYVYSSLDARPLLYTWDFRGPRIVHSGLGARFTGEFSDDGTRLTGGWRPVGKTGPTPANSYDVVMTREP